MQFTETRNGRDEDSDGSRMEVPLTGAGSHTSVVEVPVTGDHGRRTRGEELEPETRCRRGARLQLAPENGDPCSERRLPWKGAEDEQRKLRCLDANRRYRERISARAKDELEAERLDSESWKPRSVTEVNPEVGMKLPARWLCEPKTRSSAALLSMFPTLRRTGSIRRTVVHSEHFQTFL